MTCPTCSAPLPDGHVTCCCGRCGHKIDDHSPSLNCRVCGGVCGIDCTGYLTARERRHLFGDAA